MFKVLYIHRLVNKNFTLTKILCLNFNNFIFYFRRFLPAKLLSVHREVLYKNNDVLPEIEKCINIEDKDKEDKKEREREREVFHKKN